MNAQNNRIFSRTLAIEVKQPIGVFYATAIPARDLLTVCYTDKLKAIQKGASYGLEGAQRLLRDDRLKEIGRYIDTTESAFPNSVILAANYEEKDRHLVSDETRKWRIECNDKRSNSLELVIPSNEPLAAVIDGQHRLFGFTMASAESLDMLVLCSVFLDLPRPYQAFLFATINSTQKRVDRSQTYELFGYNIDEEQPEFWSPEKLAVFLTRRLNIEERSPFRQRILVAAENDFAISRAEARAQERWMVSTATVVDGITRLISTSPKSDADELRTRGKHKRSILSYSIRRDKAPLRELYLSILDKVLFEAVSNFFTALLEVSGPNPSDKSYLTKTVGIQALFDTLRKLAPQALEQKDFTQDWFVEKLNGLRGTDFSHQVFREASGQGRTQIRRVIFMLIGLEDNLTREQESDTKKIIDMAQALGN